MFSTIKLVSRHQNTQQFGALLSIELTNAKIRKYKAYKEYYAIATGEAVPKPKASVRGTRSSFDTSITTPTAVASPRLTAFAKGKQTAKASKAKSLSALSEVAMTKAQQLKLVTKRSMQQTHISQPSGLGADEGTGDDNEEKDDDGDEEDEGDDGEEDNDDDVKHEVDKDDDKEKGGDDDQEYNDEYAKETRDEESFDPIPQTSKNSKDDDDGEEDQGLNIGMESILRQHHNWMYKLLPLQTIQFAGAISFILGIVNHYMDQRMNEAVKVAVQIQSDRIRDETQRENDEFLRTVDENIKKIIKEQVKEQVKVQVSKILARIEQAVNEQIEAEVLTRSSHSSRTSYAVAADLSEIELKKILIEKMEGNKMKNPSLDQTEGRRDADKERSLSQRALQRKLQQGALAGPTYELIKGSCKSLVELEYHLEEVFKDTTDQLDWVNPEGQQYPHNLLQPLPLIPNNRGRRVIPFDHFINNKLEYLRGGASSRKYTTSITKTKAADYGHIKWIEDLIPRTMWIQEPIGYDKHALWGVSHWGRKRQQFYGFAVNRESARDVYSKRRVITKKLNLTKLDSYRSDLKHKEAYTAYSNPQGFIYQNKDRRNRLMRIDELHKFNDETLIDVRTALDDRLKGIRMQYLPQSIWRSSDKDRAASMIQAIDKRLKTRRIMRSLERFVGGRLYKGDFRMLQRTI
uniref:Uncharacterized protein n=1 Tax=Tanacetum cinerariifolium TaxID=118510 RepID=A0A6L2MQ37_TANCI|nr:hypothetical protein [Tanacetum cinerariifolium]